MMHVPVHVHVHVHVIESLITIWSCFSIGSILVGCAHFGGCVLGGDIDWSLIHGKGVVCTQHCQCVACVTFYLML